MKKTTCVIPVVAGLVLVVSLAGCGGQAPGPGSDPAGDTVIQVYQVDGMHCGGCERSITAAVDGLDGMRVLELSHTNGVLKVESDGRTDPSAVTAAVTPLGYQVSAVPAEAEDPDEAGE